MTLILKDKNGRYFPVIDQYANETYMLYEKDKDKIWITGVKKSILKEMNLEVFKIEKFRTNIYQYSYLVDKDAFMKYISKSEPPITAVHV